MADAHDASDAILKDHSPAEQFLQAWHARHPDAGRLFAEARAEDGTSSLERLIRVVPSGARVLDLACGAGALSTTLRQSPRVSDVLGVDLTFPELAIARQRAPGIDFAQARAQALPLRTSSFDGVLCHMALMLFDDVEAVLGEVARVLRPGGVFSAVTNSAVGMSPIGETIVRAIKQHWHASDPLKRAPVLGDPRAQTADGLRALLSPYFSHVDVHPFSVSQDVSRQSLWQYLTTAAYGLDALSDNVAHAAFDALDLPDPVPWTLPLLLAQGTRATAT